MENFQNDLFVTANIKLYYDLYLPENLKTPAKLLIAVHGYGANKRYMMREARQLADENFAVVSLQAPYQHWQKINEVYKIAFGWLTDFKPEESIALHHQFLLDVIKNLALQGIIDEKEVFLFGFSQACALNFRFAFTYPQSLRAVVGVCGGIPSDLEENSLYQPLKSDVFYLYSTDDEFYPLEKFENFNKTLQSKLINYTSKSYSAKHQITDDMRQDIKKWLKNF